MSKHYSLCQNCIHWLIDHGNHHTTLQDLSEQFHIDPGHLQKVFKHHVGITPKQFVQNLMVVRSQKLLPKQSLEQTALALNLSSSARLHDAYVKLTAMSPGEFKSLGEQLQFRFAMESSALGPLLAISTDRGLFYLGFHKEPKDVLNALKLQFPKAQFEAKPEGGILGFDPIFEPKPIDVHISGSAFQLKVWQALLSVPLGTLTSYGNLANKIGHSKSARAVGQAVGANPIAGLIPCHRVIQSSGALGGYRWGTEQKQALLSIEL